MRVKITNCSDVRHWYNNKVGQEFDVVDNGGCTVHVADSGNYILKHDYEVLSNSNKALPEVSTGTPMPQCKPPKPSAEEMLKKALEFAHSNIDGLLLYYHELNEFDLGMLQSYRYMAAHLEMLIKGAKQ